MTDTVAGGIAGGGTRPTVATRRADARGRQRAVRIIAPLMVLALLLTAWEVLPRVLGTSSINMPRLSLVLQALGDLHEAGLIWPNLKATGTEAIVGFLIGLALGVVTGSLIALYPVLETAMNPYIIAIYATPKIAIAPLLIIWLGLGSASKIAVAALIAWMPILINVLTGMRAVEPDRVDLLRAMGANKGQVLLSVRIPTALPYLFAGIQQALLLALLGAVAAEFISAREGLGYLLVQRMAILDTPSVFAILLVLSAVGIVLYYVTHWLQRRLIFWTRA